MNVDVDQMTPEFTSSYLCEFVSKSGGVKAESAISCAEMGEILIAMYDLQFKTYSPKRRAGWYIT